MKLQIRLIATIMTVMAIAACASQNDNLNKQVDSNQTPPLIPELTPADLTMEMMAGAWEYIEGEERRQVLLGADGSVEITILEPTPSGNTLHGKGKGSWQINDDIIATEAQVIFEEIGGAESPTETRVMNEMFKVLDRYSIQSIIEGRDGLIYKLH